MHDAVDGEPGAAPRGQANHHDTGRCFAFAMPEFSEWTAICPECRGTGAVSLLLSTRTCKRCGGAGMVRGSVAAAEGKADSGWRFLAAVVTPARRPGVENRMTDKEIKDVDCIVGWITTVSPDGRSEESDLVAKGTRSADGEWSYGVAHPRPRIRWRGRGGTGVSVYSARGKTYQKVNGGPCEEVEQTVTPEAKAPKIDEQPGGYDPDPGYGFLPSESVFSLVNWQEPGSAESSGVCPDCNGAGSVALLVSRSPCKTCGGTRRGRIADWGLRTAN